MSHVDNNSEAIHTPVNHSNCELDQSFVTNNSPLPSGFDVSSIRIDESVSPTLLKLNDSVDHQQDMHSHNISENLVRSPSILLQSLSVNHLQSSNHQLHPSSSHCHTNVVRIDNPITLTNNSNLCDTSHLSTNIPGSDDDDSVFNLPPPLSPLPNVISQPGPQHDLSNGPLNPDIGDSPDEIPDITH